MTEADRFLAVHTPGTLGALESKHLGNRADEDTSTDTNCIHPNQSRVCSLLYGGKGQGPGVCHLQDECADGDLAVLGVGGFGVCQALHHYAGGRHRHLQVQFPLIPSCLYEFSASLTS